MSQIRSIVAICVLFACSAVSASAGESDVERLVAFMVGSFSSEAQAVADTAYYDIRLEVVRIWPDRDDGHWLYVEQALAGRVDEPYRQRVYRVNETDEGLYTSEVFEIPEEDDYIGAWSSAEPLSDLAPEDLELREGCGVVLRPDGRGGFTGGTIGHGCSSRIAGAAYATSEVALGPTGMESWDRGFDGNGVQVWGAEKGPYVFARRLGSPNQARILPAQLASAIDAFYGAIERGDVETRISLLADDVLMMPNHWTMTKGKDAVAEGLRSAAGAVFRIRDRKVLRASVSGDIAFTVNSYDYTYHNEGEPAQWHKTKNLHVWRRGEDGIWKLEVDIWNSDVPMARFDEE